ncbi:acyl carrier protein [Streptomyces bacillaris]|uniref:acyl carrier protein n=1 Tax=Streptomyces bacillaris TaxID=68179 RepID=UPI003460F76E
MTLSQLQEVLRECAGEDEASMAVGVAPDQTFSDLGYDSLAILETQSRIQRDFGVKISDDAMQDLKTPKALVDHVNSLLDKSI